MQRRIDPRGFVTEFLEYDLFGNARRVRDPLGNITVSDFDERGRLLEVRTPSPATPGMPTTGLTRVFSRSTWMISAAWRLAPEARWVRGIFPMARLLRRRTPWDW